MNSRGDKEANVERAVELIQEGVEKGADLVALPENFNFLGERENKLRNAESIPGPTTTRMAGEAKKHGLYILAGSIPERIKGADKVYNTSVLFDPNGEEIARYRKLHLFDIEVEGQVSAQESATVRGGDELVVAETELATLGLTICYDIRFPELYRSLTLKGAEVIFSPAAFTLYTGKDHWETILRTRAVENTVFMVAPAQIGVHPPGKRCFGSAMIVDPWGTVIARAAEREMAVVADIDLELLENVRTNLPSLQHRKPEVYEL
jgi:predicted amidohydrolase